MERELTGRLLERPGAVNDKLEEDCASQRKKGDEDRSAEIFSWRAAASFGR